VWLNVASFETLPAGKPTIAWHASQHWYGELCALVSQSVELPDGDGLFARAMRTVATELHAALAALAPSGEQVPAPPWVNDSPPPTLQALYDRACVHARKGYLQSALGLLSFVTSAKSFRDAAWADPWFATFRTEGGSGPLADVRKRFKELVGPAEPSYVEGADIGTKKQALLDLGVDTAQDLLLVTKDVTARTDLARSLDVPRTVIDLWRSDAQTASARVAGGPSGETGQA
jgi:hypothetical protein